MTRFLVGNWKMHLLPEESGALASQIVGELTLDSNVEVWIAPTFLSIPTVATVAAGSALKVGAQNAYFEDSGAYTGETSAHMLAQLGCTFSIIGHSERRVIFGESNELCVDRALGLLNRGFGCIYCVGEKLSDRESNTTNEVLEAQLTPLFAKISSQNSSKLILAYEPVWAIGTGKVATTAEIEAAHHGIVSLWKKWCKALAVPPILYGGSVKPENFSEILQVPNVDGALVGGASLQAESFLSLLRVAAR